MSMLYDRVESEDQIVIRFTRYLHALLAIGAAYVVLVLLVRNVWLSLLVSLGLVFIISRDMGSVRKELVAAQQAGVLTKSGRRMSFRNPLTYVIRKRPAKKPRKGKRSR